MATIDEQRHQMIRRIVMQRHDSTATDTILLWERLACELTAIIGHAGFDTLYVRRAPGPRSAPRLADRRGSQFRFIEELPAANASPSNGGQHLAAHHPHRHLDPTDRRTVDDDYFTFGMGHRRRRYRR